MSDLAPVVAGSTIGPLFRYKERRKHYSHELAETCSLTDRVFQDKSLPTKPDFLDFRFPNPFVVSATPSLEEGSSYLPQISKNPLVVYPVIEEYRDMIREHIERKILFFFLQLIVCYQTKLHFEMAGAQDQAKSADSILFEVNGKQGVLAARQATHSSTAPCLIAYDKTQWETYQEGQGQFPQGFTFLKGTDYYRTVNATMNMPRWVNDADREIDEKTTDSLLRRKALALLNCAAQGDITPDEGIINFIREALNEVQAAQERLYKQNKDPAVQKVLSLYEEYFIRFQQEIEKDPSFLEKFLNITFDPVTTDGIAQRVILQIRYGAIRDNHIAQARLAQKVAAVSKEVLASISLAFCSLNSLKYKLLLKILLDRDIPDKKPNYFDGAFKTLLVGQACTLQDRHRLSKLLNFSSTDFESQLNTQRKKTQFTRIITALSVPIYLKKIKALAQDILQDMHFLRTQEKYKRAQVIRDLRIMKGWSRRELSKKMKAIFPGTAASQWEGIFLIENQQWCVTSQMAKEFSQIFRVDPGLFIPHFFYE